MDDVSRLKDVDLVDNIGNIIEIRALVDRADIRKDKNKHDYLDIDVIDYSVKVNIKVWGFLGNPKEHMQKSKVYRLVVKVILFGDNVQFELLDFTELGEPPINYLNTIENPEKIIEMLAKIMSTLDETRSITKITRRLFEINIEKFTKYPAAKSIHHNIISGLMKHTVDIARRAYNETRINSNLDWTLLGCSALLHDMGKVKEYDIDFNTGNFEYSIEGILKGHIVIIVLDIMETAKEMGLYSDEKDKKDVDLLVHSILSHHGRLEWGSPVKPATTEARILHHLDNLDAKIYRSIEKLETMKDGEVDKDFIHGDLEMYVKL